MVDFYGIFMLMVLLFFFLCVYFHIFRNLYYVTYISPRIFVWILGMFIFILMILTAFLGYVLPWGQMSFWAATVITSLFSIFPIYGMDIVTWLWGGFSVNNVTLTRFFSLHYLFPFIIFILIILHVLFLHNKGSSIPEGISLKLDKIWFTPYFVRKDLYIIILFLLLFISITTFYPNFLGHTDNYILANPIVTPAHIVPEWYFLPFYAILRSIPNKVGGIIILIITLCFLIMLPFFSISLWRNTFFFKPNQILAWFLCYTYILLGWLGGCPIEYPYIFLGQFLTLFFLLLLSFSPLILWIFLKKNFFFPLILK
jgi:quinol-cytochrome oxidoreductase complex cytochrome b subunit